MSQSVAYKHYIRGLSRWPKDILRPETQFTDVIRRRIDKKFLPAANGSAAAPVNEKAELRQVNALYSLLEDRYKRKYPLSDKIMKPASNPNLYQDLLKELEAAPTRTYFQGLINRWKKMVRFK
ncbi:hypothetical protein CJF32_00001141 [Rutstroemia sp. NJR-2017a WRK4]|nr:hypothetical protein CJF32_00001141 [Rutstroemia sp. NJR-2017a WRK4]